MEDQDVFEITDFTTASDWERFIVQIEATIHEWKLSSVRKKPPLKKDELSKKIWCHSSQNLQFVNFEFVISHYYMKRDEDETIINEEESEADESLPSALIEMASTENDFPSDSHCLTRWYGLTEFMILRASFIEGISTETRAKLLLSSAAIALNNTNCHIPLFVQVHQLSQEFYIGICEVANIRTNYEMVYLKRLPSQCNHLAGLLDVFKSKLANPLTVPQSVKVSIRFTYTLDNWTHHVWPQLPPDIAKFMGEVGVTKFGELPSGAFEDPISQLHLCTTWPYLSEDVVVDSAVFTDLNPVHAPEWMVKLCVKSNLQCLLFEYLSDFRRLCRRRETSAHVLGHEIEEDDDDGVKISQALEKLTDHAVKIPTLSSVVSRAKSRLHAQGEAPISTELIIKILQFIFPDAAVIITDCISDENLIMDCEENTILQNLKEQMKTLKSAPVSSLTSRLALAMCHINHSYGGLRGVAHLWQEFVLEMRYRWENQYPLPCMEFGMPNLGCCILHQKLQMLNCCILRKKTRESQIGKRSSAPQASVDISDDEDEFFECEETVNDADKNLKSSIDSDGLESRSSTVHDESTTAPEGRQTRFGDSKILGTDISIYIPETQEPAPMTEDLLEEHAKVLLQLGTDSEGSHLRAKMQSASLMSDMGAFKAANPEAGLEDFVRWYSPRDWMEEEIVDEISGKTQIKSHLSARMMIPGNMWQDVWENSKPIPARRQKRLFDDTKEAEKVLHFFASLSPAQVAMHLFPMLIHSSIVTLIRRCDGKFPLLVNLLDLIVKKSIKVTRSSSPDLQMYEELIKMIGAAERYVAQIKSIKAKFFPGDDPHSTEDSAIPAKSSTRTGVKSSEEDQATEKFIYELLECKEVKVIGAGRGPIGQIIKGLFEEAQKSMNMIFDDAPLGNGDKSSVKTSELRHSTITEFPPASEKEFILRTAIPRPSTYSATTPQRMHCVLGKDSFRLAGAFTEDTTFQ
ncbi:RAB3GAP1 (predicted) [Pycnogonum litorale]